MIVSLLAAYIYDRFFSYSPPQIAYRGILRPGNLSAWREPTTFFCGRSFFSSNEFKVFLGTTNVVSVNRDNLVAIRIGLYDVISLKRVKGGVTISALLFSDDGLYGRMVDNKFEINPNDYFVPEFPTPSELFIYDRWNREIVAIK